MRVGKFIIGLTGGIASGKSTIAKFFHEHGIAVISADVVAHDLMQAGTKLVLQIQQVFKDEFGQESLLNQNNELDRVKLRDIIFNSNLARRRLDQLTHPAISNELLKRVQNAQSAYVVTEIPLLIEANMQELVNRILVVETTSDVQLARVMQRDNVSHEQAQKVLDAQLSNEQRRVYADDIIYNNGSLDKIKNSVNLLHKAYLKAAKDTKPILGLAIH